ncbi:histidine phosphatase superfamily [Tribonema minus]|uniref:Phosphoglycerate mutase n=1 Tax=Tribonema minus TaxID=303371 RepID=A0A835Z7E5_9STRA|nr:histidine phosphatase superfamily [Tribonema minus]
MPEVKYTLVLIRHGESDWNRQNRFTGWHDVPLSETGELEAAEAGKTLAKEGLQFDAVYTSVLRRAIKTAWHCMEQTNQMWLPVTRAWQLNERHYGGLTGLNKAETVAKVGEAQVLIWRRSYDIPPPEVETTSEYYPGNDRRYKALTPEQLPKTESLKLTLERVLPYWESDIKPAMQSGKRLLIAAHGNSLRALVKHLDGIPDDVIPGLNIPTGIPLVYELDEDFKPIPSADAIAPLNGRYLGDREMVEARIAGATSTGHK